THAPTSVPPPPLVEADGLSPPVDADGAVDDAAVVADGAADDDACGDPQAPTTIARTISAAAGRRKPRMLNTHLLLECESTAVGRPPARRSTDRLTLVGLYRQTSTAA